MSDGSRGTTGSADTDAVTEAVRLTVEYPLWVLACAQRFHDTYEAIAPKHGYATAEKSRVPWHELDDNLRALMCETVQLVIGADPTEPYAQVAALTAERERLQAALGGGEALQGAPIPDHGIEGITPEMVDELLAERPPSGDDVEGRA